MTTPLMVPEHTMVGTANNVGLWIAPAGTAAPSALGTAFAAPWVPLGYTSDDGVTLGGDQTVESFVPWQGITPIKSIITEKTKTVGFTLWELNRTTLGLYFDEVITGTGASFNFQVKTTGVQQVHAIAVDAMDADMHLRIAYTRATLESTGDMTINKGAMVPLEVTLNALDDGGNLTHVFVGPATGAARAGETTTQQTASASTGRGRKSDLEG